MIKSCTQLIILLLLFTHTNLLSQELHRCYSNEKMAEHHASNPEYFDEINESIKQFRKQYDTKNHMMFIEIPVHVIIVHPPGQAVGTGSNLSLEQIESQIEVLNEDFTASNDDYGDVPGGFSPGDPSILFCLASTDENGDPTDGVTRYGTNSNFDNNEFSIKSATGWDRNTYLNMWVAPSIGALGYAYVPTTFSLPNATLDGVAIWTGTFGGPGYNSPPYNLGRTTTHEVGHYLGLPHVWGNGGCGSDDGFTDTPTQSGSNFGCPTHPSPSCGNGGDMFMNYMDYVNDNCMVAFSEDQSDYMNTILNTSRSSLLNAADFACGISTTPLVLDLVLTEDLECGGDEDGVISVIASGGTGGYTYFIDYGNLSNSTGYFESLPGGTYTITVFDSSNESISITVSISEPSAILTNVVYVEDVECHGDESAIVTIIASGGASSTYSYTIDNGTFQNSPTFENLGAGEYTIQVYDVNACSAEVEIEINEPDALSVDSLYITPVSCYGEEDGEVEFFTSGGVGNNTLQFDTFAPTWMTVYDTLVAGDYQLVLSDFNDCTDTTWISIPEPDSMEMISLLEVSPSCFGEDSGEIQVDVLGGNGQEDYYINGQLNSNDSVFVNLAAGDYIISAIDSNGCEVSLITNLSEAEALQLTAIQIVDGGCDGSLGSIALNLDNGQGTISYTLNGDTNTDGAFTDLPAGNYTATAIDENNCEASYTFDIIQQSNLILTIEEQQNNLCAGAMEGEVLLSTGGVANITYTLNGASNTTGLFTGLGEGTYTVYASNGGECEDEIEFTITEPEALNASIASQNNPLCNGDTNGSFVINAGGGTGILSYSIGNNSNTDGIFNDMGPGTFLVKIEDENGCEISQAVTLNNPTQLQINTESIAHPTCAESMDGAVSVIATGGTGSFNYTLGSESNTSGDFSGLMPGSYEIIAVDDNGCEISIQATIEEVAAINLTVGNIEQPTCAGIDDGAINITASGGTGSLVYTLNGGDPQSSGSFSNLGGGEYTIEVTDENDCSIMSETIELNSPSAIDITFEEVMDVVCNGESNGSIQITGVGGNGNLSYQLGSESNDAGLFENLPADTYTITIVDELGCETESSYIVAEPEALASSNLETTPVTCFGDTDGTVTFEISGGTDPYMYTINGMSDVDINNLPAGEYTLEIEDASACMSSTTFMVSEPEPVDTSAIIISLSSDGESGDLKIEAIGGTPPYSYALDFGEFQESPYFYGVSSQQIEVQVMDANGCLQSFIIDMPILSNVGDSFESLQHFGLYPNPAEDEIKVHLESNVEQTLQMHVFSIEGKLLWNQTMNVPAGSHTSSKIDIDHYAAGLYYVVLSNNEGLATLKFIKR